MNGKRYIAYMLLACSMAAVGPEVSASGETVRGKIRVEGLEVRKENRQVSIEMTFDLSSLDLPSNRYLTLTPCITDGTDTVALRKLIISGRRQHIMYARERHRYEEYTGAEELRFRPKKDQKVPYSTIVPYDRWMHGAALIIEEEWCGCGGYTQENKENRLTQLALLPEVYEITPLLAYMEPESEAVKAREEKGSAFLDFRVNSTEIDGTYRRNPEELSKIRRTIERVKGDRDLTIKGISIHGYASPEASYALNERLSRGRASSLKEYVLGLCDLADSLIEVSVTPEDWEGLRRMAEDSELPDKARIIEIIDGDYAPDFKESLLKNIGDGSAYRYMLREWFPALRHSDYTVHYIVRGFDVEEAKRLVRTRPQKLSLHEMFVVSREYEPGSEEFDQVFDVAVRMYPEDPTANLNAANIAIADGVYDKAASYLEKAGDSPEAVHARGVLAMMRGEYGKARMLLEQAEESGIEEASYNLGELDKKIENNNQLN